MSNECSYCGKELTTDSYNQTCSDCRRKLNNDLHNDVLLEAPTAQEVCKALSEFLQGTNINVSVEVTFENNNFMYFHTIVVQDIGGHLWFDFPVALPPRLVKMIGRFYEGLNDE